jgi:murein peptide amidase A
MKKNYSNKVNTILKQKLFLLITIFYIFFIYQPLTTLGLPHAIKVTHSILRDNYANIDFVSSHKNNSFTKKKYCTSSIKTLCNKLKKIYATYKWQGDPCRNIKWRAYGQTNNKNPLIYTQIGSGANTTLILGGVHADELTPMHLAFKFAQILSKQNTSGQKFKNTNFIIAPLVSPDGLFKNKPLRTNGLVDPNRNFLTRDWYKKFPKKNTLKTQRYFPGFFPRTEKETLFQEYLVKKYKVKKIITIHAPLGFIDYDGPLEFKNCYTKKITNLNSAHRNFALNFASTCGNYRLVNFSIYPGSLGNYYGYEKNIPTLTIELKTANAMDVKKHWKDFYPALLAAGKYTFNTN